MINIEDLAKAFLEQMNEWHTYSEPYDDDLDAWLHERYAQVKRQKKKVDWRKMYFSPSSASKQATELFAKSKRFKKDEIRWKPHQRRYMSQGTALGDWLQRDILLCERHYEKFTGEKPRFVMSLVDDNPAFEDFVYVSKEVTHNGHTFNLNGTTDGIMIDTKTGKPVIIEFKSKQSTPAKTSLYSMREAEQKHIDQVVCYSQMYGVMDAIIVYVNGAKEGWFATDEKLAKTPDLRAFHIEVTDEMVDEVMTHLSDTAEIIKSGEMPVPSLTEWEFSEYKQSIVDRLTDDQYKQLLQVAEFQLQTTTGFMNDMIRKALLDVKRRRKVSAKH